MEVSAYESVRKESFQCNYTHKLVRPLMNLEAPYCGGGISILQSDWFRERPAFYDLAP